MHLCGLPAEVSDPDVFFAHETTFKHVSPIVLIRLQLRLGFLMLICWIIP